MTTSHPVRTVAVALGATLSVAAASTLVAAGPSTAAPAQRRHVLLLSVDGMHQADLSWFVQHHPRSALAQLVHRGTEFTRARTPFPSDSFPGLVAQLTGGNPGTTGVYYDVTYNRSLIDPAASARVTPPKSVCSSAPRGANVPFDESLDRDNTRLDAGQGLAKLPRDILKLTPRPGRLIDPTTLPIDPKTCRRVYPHSYLRVNTVFDVVKQHGMRTAWADKHPAYEILGGPSGKGLDDLFTPEINSIGDKAGDDWTQVNSLTQRYDHFKVRAVLNEIHGLDHSGRRRVGVPGVFGMNFQSVSTAEKLPTSGGKQGGYVNHGATPGPVLRSALTYVNHEVSSMVGALKRSHQYARTTIILSAKHGQAPMARESLKRIDDGAIVDGLNAAWQSAHPSARQPLVAASLNDDGMLLWFSPGNQTATADTFATGFIKSYDGTGTGSDGKAKSTDINGAAVAYTSAGVATIHAGPAAARFMQAPVHDPRLPDLIGVVQHGVVYTGKTSKIAEHGGDSNEDRHVPLVVAGPGIGHAVTSTSVETTQIAPTILRLLGLKPRALAAVRAEHTRVLPVP